MHPFIFFSKLNEGNGLCNHKLAMTVLYGIISADKRSIMINVLKNWTQIGDATQSLQRKYLPRHLSPEKNWDLYELVNLLTPLPRDLKIIDLGCGDLYALQALEKIGFKNLTGVDVALAWRHRFDQAKGMLKRLTARPSYSLRKRDILKTGFKDDTFDAAICISVIEHGVPLKDFFREAYRILAPQGILFMTTDYWQDKIEVSSTLRAFKRPWKIFSRTDIEELLAISKDTGFSPYKDTNIPDCENRCVVWNEREFTFINVILKKSAKREG